MSPCDISQAIEKTLEDIISKELPKFRGSSKEKPISEDQLTQIPKLPHERPDRPDAKGSDEYSK
jgi:hypothetical protein